MVGFFFSLFEFFFSFAGLFCRFFVAVVFLFGFVCLFGVCFGFGSLFILVFCLSIVVIVFGLFFIVCVVVHNREKPFVFFLHALCMNYEVNK